MNACRLVTVAAVLALAALLQACATLPGQRPDADAMLKASGLDAQLELLKQPLKTGKMEGTLAMIPDEWISLVNTTIADTLKPEQIRSELKATLEKNLSAQEISAVQKFYESDSGRHIVAMESGHPEKTAGNPSQKQNNRATLDVLADATGAGKAISILAEHGLNDAIDIAVKNNCFGLDKVPFASLFIGAIKKSQLNALKQSVNASIRTQYAGLSTDDQSAYLEFAQSTPGQKFFNARTSIMSNAAEKTGDALNSQLGQAISQICNSSTH